MKFIGITGGVGAGKSKILDYLAGKPNVRVMIAHDLMEPGTACYERLRERFRNEDIYCEDGHFDRLKLASVIFSDEDKREQLNAIVHPAVKEYVKQQLLEERRQGQLQLLVLEAALLIEEHYDEICDELWYINTSRGYSDAKVDQIFASQLSEEEYERHCKVVIDNNGLPEQTFAQIDEALRREAYE